MTMMENLIGVCIQGHWTITSVGVLSGVEVYISVVKSQNQASLHLHLLLWMKETPTIDKLKDLFKTSEFRVKVTKYISDMIQAQISDTDKETIKNIACKVDLAWSRPLNPVSASFAVDRVDLEQCLVRCNQIHTC